MASASRMIGIDFVVEPQDGKTPVYNATTNKWSYDGAPTAARLEESVAQLNAINDNASVAIDKADSADAKAIAAKTAADNAKSVADTKVTAEEALDETRNSLFEITPLDSKKIRRLRSIEFKEVSIARWEIWMNWEGPNLTPNSTDVAGWLNFASPAEVNLLNSKLEALEQRVAAIEQQLGISS